MSTWTLSARQPTVTAPDTRAVTAFRPRQQTRRPHAVTRGPPTSSSPAWASGRSGPAAARASPRVSGAGSGCCRGACSCPSTGERGQLQARTQRLSPLGGPPVSDIYVKATVCSTSLHRRAPALSQEDPSSRVIYQVQPEPNLLSLLPVKPQTEVGHRGAPERQKPVSAEAAG